MLLDEKYHYVGRLAMPLRPESKRRDNEGLY